MSSQQYPSGRTLVAEYKVADFVSRFLDYYGKVLPGIDLNPTPLDLEPIRAQLLRLRDQRGGKSPEALALEASKIQQLLTDAFAELAEREAPIAPTSFRQFVTRTWKENQKILSALLKFYNLIGGIGEWTDERTDKTDFLFSLLGRRVNLIELGGMLSEVRDLGRHEVAEIEAARLEEAVSKIRKFRNRAVEVTTVEDLNDDEGVLEEYRSLKHQLGRALFEPQIAMVIVGTNAAFKKVADPLIETAQKELVKEYEAAALVWDPDTNQLPMEKREQWNELDREIEDLTATRQTGGIKSTQLTGVRDRVHALLADMPKQEPNSCENGGYLEALEALEAENRLLKDAISELTIEKQALKNALEEAISRLSGVSPLRQPVPSN